MIIKCSCIFMFTQDIWQMSFKSVVSSSAVVPIQLTDTLGVTTWRVSSDYHFVYSYISVQMSQLF